MTPHLQELLSQLAINPAFVALALATVLTAVVLAAQAIAQWFDDRNP